MSSSVILACLWSALLSQAPVPETALGRIAGVVKDKAGEPLIEAQVTVVQLGRRVLTDVDGKYEVTVPAGTYDVRVWAELMPARRIGPVEVEAGKTVALDVELGTEEDAQIAVQEVIVVARPDTTSTAVQVLRRRKATSVTDAISAEQIARSPDSNASDAVKRVVAATVQDNKYIVVRGLGGRYSSTLLNGVPLPSPDPDNAAVPLDLFPAALLANLTVAKTYSPDLPGNFAGGTLQIETRDFPAELLGRLKLSSSGDTASTFATTLDHGTGAGDFFGYGERSLPSSIPNDGPLVASGDLSQADADARAKAFADDWSPSSRRALPGQGFSATLGDTVALGDMRLGYLGSANFGRKTTRRSSTVRRTNEDATSVVEQRRVETGTDTSSLGLLLSSGLELSPTQRLGFIALYTHGADDSAQRTHYSPEGQAASSTVERTSLRFVERSLTLAQLVGDHQGAGLLLHWQANVSRTSQLEPDSRDTTYISSLGGPYTIATSGAGSADRLFATLDDTSGGGALDVTKELTALRLKGGVAAQLTSRRFSSRRFRFAVRDLALVSLPADALLTDTYLGRGVSVGEVTRFTDAYRAGRDVLAGYALADITVLEPLRIALGARYEHAAQQIHIGSRFATTNSRSDVDRAEGHLLPSLNAILALGSDASLRGAYSLTVARPSFRELSPVLFYDFSRGRTASGNPELVTTAVHNLDLRFERFLGAADLLAATGFVKLFDDPIESTFKDQNGDTLTYVNTPGARLYGLEVEGRSSLGELARGLEWLYVGANLSLVRSRIELGDASASSIEGTRRRRPLQGQSPYVLNVELGAHRASSKTDVSLLYNVAGRRISEVGVGGSPDSYEQPFHRLDLSLSQTLADAWKLKLAAQNLLDQRVRVTRRDVVLSSFAPGVAFSASIEWSLN